MIKEKQLLSFLKKGILCKKKTQPFGCKIENKPLTVVPVFMDLVQFDSVLWSNMLIMHIKEQFQHRYLMMMNAYLESSAKHVYLVACDA